MRARDRIGRVAVLAVLGLAPTGCTEHDSLVLLDLRSSGPLGAPAASIRLSAKGWPTRTVPGSIGPGGFRVGYYGPGNGGAVSVTAEALDADRCVLGSGSATVAALAEGATSAPTTLFVRPLPNNDCAVVDAGTDTGGGDNDGGADGGSDTRGDACGMQCIGGPVPVERVAGTCVYPFPCGVVGDDRLQVFADGVELPRDQGDPTRWSYTDASQTAVRIDGALCTDIMNGAVVAVTIAPRCGPIP